MAPSPASKWDGKSPSGHAKLNNDRKLDANGFLAFCRLSKAGALDLGAVKDRLARELGAEEQSLVLVRIEWRRRVE